jgi:UDP-3-O-[3-hydroxymyristoyl] glucosamine N-acyltransferase
MNSREREMVESITGNARFFSRSGPYTLAIVAGAARGIADEFDLLLEGLAPLQTAGPNEVSFLDNRRYASALDQTLAGAVIVHPDMAARVPTGTVAILTSEPYAGGHALLHCSIPCHRFLQVFTRPQLSLRVRSSIHRRRSDLCL